MNPNYKHNPLYRDLYNEIERIMGITYHYKTDLERISKVETQLKYLIDTRKLYDYKVCRDDGIFTIYFKWQKVTEIEVFNDSMLLPYLREKKLKRTLNEI